MLTALRSAKFMDAHSTLEVRECADRAQVQILVESHSRMGEQHVLMLSTADWSQLMQLPYVDRLDCDQRPDNILEAFMLADEHTSLEIHERADANTVLIVMNGRSDRADEDAIMIELTAAQWRYLCSLDYLDEESQHEVEQPVSLERPAGRTIH